MDILDKYIKFVHRWEGGLSRDTADSCSAMPCPTPYKGKIGWHTNIGICYSTWVGHFGHDNDMRFLEMNAEDWFKVFKKGYWDTMRGDEYTSKECAVFIVGMCWGSGKRQATKSLQQAIINCGVKVEKDGLLGGKTIAAANSIDPCKLFDALTAERERFFRVIGRPGSKNAKFLKGWLNRLSDYKVTFKIC